MAETASMESNASCYRVKFDRAIFLELVRVAKPKIIYSRKTCISSPTTDS